MAAGGLISIMRGIMEKPSHFITIKAQIMAWVEKPFRPVHGYSRTEDKSRFRKRES